MTKVVHGGLEPSWRRNARAANAGVRRAGEQRRSPMLGPIRPQRHRSREQQTPEPEPCSTNISTTRSS